jgi:uncharacterized protein
MGDSTVKGLWDACSTGFFMGTLRELPLFPLNTVLFPGMNLPLHIFEPRYRLMIGSCIENHRPFGVVLIQEGREVGPAARPYQIGTSAYVTQVERLADHRLNIQTIGYQRFKIHAIERHKPYLIGLVEDAPLTGEDNPANMAVAEPLTRTLQTYLHTLKKASDEAITLDTIPDRPMALAFLAAIVLPLPNHEKQALLACDDLGDLLRLEYALVRRETLLLKHMLEHGQREGDAELFSYN